MQAALIPPDDSEEPGAAAPGRKERSQGAIEYETLRSRRKRAIGKRTEPLGKLPKYRLQLIKDENAELGHYQRPKKRGDCEGGIRPCPFIGCKHNLYADINAKGSMTFNFPDLEVDQMGVSCALDVADRGGSTLEQVGEILNLTRERIRQIEVKALARAERHTAFAALAEFDEGLSLSPGRGRLPDPNPGKSGDPKKPHRCRPSIPDELIEARIFDAVRRLPSERSISRIALAARGRMKRVLAVAKRLCDEGRIIKLDTGFAVA